MSWLHDRTTDLIARVNEVKELDAFPFFRRFENVGPRVKVADGSYLNFMSNDYLGLSQHPKLIRQAIAGTQQYGTGLGSARPQATSIRHEELEESLARWLSYEACAVFTTGYQALVGVMQSFLDDDTTVVLDKLSHAAIIDGVLLAHGQHPDLEMRFFKHNSVEALEKTLETAEHDKKMVVVEGLYSVDGDVAPVDKMLEVCRKHGAVVVLDDAHGLGTIGRTGRGISELLNVENEVDILIGTFSKSFGAVGGFVCADRDLIDYLKLTARSFVFSASLPLAQVEAASAALEIIEKEHWRFRKLEQNASYFREGLRSTGLDIGDATMHITPIMLRDEELTMKFGAYLFHGAGVMMMPFIYPGVPKGTERLRCNVTAVHTESQMGYTLEALAEIGQRLGVLPKGTRTGASQYQRALWLVDHKLRSIKQGGRAYLRREAIAAGRNAADWVKRRWL